VIVKLIAVLALAVLSVPRTLAVVAMAGVKRPQPGSVIGLLRGTAIFVVGIAGLAVWLAHGWRAQFANATKTRGLALGTFHARA